MLPESIARSVTTTTRAANGSLRSARTAKNPSGNEQDVRRQIAAIGGRATSAAGIEIQRRAILDSKKKMDRAIPAHDDRHHGGGDEDQRGSIEPFVTRG